MSKVCRLIFQNRVLPGKSIIIDKKLFLDAKPAIRIYRWSCPTVSIGCGQNLDDFRNFIKKGYKVVKRITGGGAVIHRDDICFSIVIPKSASFFGNIKDTIYKIQSGIRNVLNPYIKKIKINLKEPDRYTKFCFLTKSKYDLVSLRRKISGVAFYKSAKAIIYQGSIDIGKLNFSFNEFSNLLVNEWQKYFFKN